MSINEIKLNYLSNSGLKVAWNNKGLTFAILENYEEAIICYEKAIELDENYEEAKKYLAEAKEKNLQ